MFRVVTLLAAVAIVGSASVPLDAKNPKRCKRTNVRPANPQGSVLVQPSTATAAASAATPTTDAPVMVFGGAEPITDRSATGTVVPGIASERGPAAGSVPPRRKARKSRRSAAFDASSLPNLGAIAASSSC